MLAGLPQAPSQYNPFRNPTAALERRNEVLNEMVKSKYITRAEADAAAAKGLDLKRGTRYTERREPYFFDFVEEQLIERYGVGVYRRGGLKIHTTIDPDLQEAGRQAIRNSLYYKDDPSSAIVSIDPHNGYIKAMASSGTYNDRTFNLAAQGHRQPGSAFKTFVLVTAIREGLNPNSTTYVSKPLTLNVPGYGPWNVKTYGNTYGGSMNLVEATIKSDNTVYAQLDIDLGPEKVKETAKAMGITTELDGIPSEGLGGLRLGVSPLEMANAYATLAAGGKRHKPIAIKRVEFPDGKSENLGEPERKRVFSDGIAYETTKILQQNVQRGTGTKANIGCPAAGQDRHDRQLQRRVVRRLHARPRDLGLGRLPERAHRDARRPRDQRRRRHVPDADLGLLHEHRQGRRLPLVPASEPACQLLPVLRPPRNHGAQLRPQLRLPRAGPKRRGEQLGRWTGLPRLRPAPLRSPAAAGACAHAYAFAAVQRRRRHRRPGPGRSVTRTQS